MGKETRLTFRKLTPDDAEAVAELDLKSFGERDAWSREGFFYVAQDNCFEYLVAELNGELVACAGAEVYSDTAEIESLAVDPKYRRRGIGARLLVELIDAILKRGATFMVLEVRPSNKAAIKLYEKFGFQVVERERNYYRDEDAWIMARDFS